MENETPAVFDSSRQISLKLLGPDGIRVAQARFPTDGEWIDRTRRRKIMRISVGRGKSTTTLPEPGEADTKLFAKLLIGEEGTPDPYESARVLEVLAACEVRDCKREGSVFRVKTQVPGGTTVHIVKLPTARDMTQFGYLTDSVEMPNGRSEVTVDLTAGGTIYDRLMQSTEGYAGAVPVWHKTEVVRVVIDAVRAELQDDTTENF